MSAMQLTEVPYPNCFHADTTAVALTYRAALAGHRGPRLDMPFSYLDIGCGSGTTLIALASVHPHAEFVGLDLSALHIATARRLAGDCGLDNVQFLHQDINDTGDFSDRPFDFIVAHGVISWVSSATAHRVLALACDHLRPGGLLFLSYNRTPEAQRIAPIRAYLRRFAEDRQCGSAVDCIEAALEHWDRQGRRVFAAGSRLDEVLEYFAAVPAEALAHEFLGDHWHPWSSGALYGLLKARGLAPLGDPLAASSQKIDRPPFAIICQRDLFTKHPQQGAAVRDPSAFDGMMLCLSGHSTIGPYSVWTEGKRLDLPEGLLRDLRQELESRPWCAAGYFSRVGQAPADRDRVHKAVAQLVGQAVLAPCVDGQRPARGYCRPPLRFPLPFNQVMLSTDLDFGAHLLMSPITGSAVTLQPLERLILRALQGDRPEAACRSAIEEGEVALGDLDGTKDTDASELTEQIVACMQSFIAVRLPVLARLGICEGS